MNQKLFKKYSLLKEQYLCELVKLKSISLKISTARIVSFVIFLLCVYFYIKTSSVYLIPISLMCLSLFLGLIKKSIMLQKEIKLKEKLVFINANELSILQHEPSALRVANDETDPKSYDKDLDLFGQFSLFYLINRTGFITGEQKLVQLLKQPYTSTDAIIRTQEQVKEMAPKLDFRQHIQAHTLLIDAIDQQAILNQEIDQLDYTKYKNFFIKYAPKIWTLLALVVIAASVHFGSLSWIGIFWLCGMIIIGPHVKTTTKLHRVVAKQNDAYQNLSKVFDLIHRESFQCTELVNIHQRAEEASRGFAMLKKVTNEFDQRYNFLVASILNGFVLYDLACINGVTQWLDLYQKSRSKWLDDLAQLELVSSLAGFYYNHEMYVFPIPVKGALNYKATNLGHPLIREEHRVDNSVAFDDALNVFLLTGANMSGKSTFLRSIGANLVLAQMGLPVCASHFEFSIMQILTSLHQADSLTENKSYFYAELERLKTIIDRSAERPSLILLDEVLRGTNSEDKRNGSRLLIERLLKQNCLVVIATHDVELGVLEDLYPNKLRNICFESQLVEDELIFDFKLKSGVAKNKNASYLMKKMGIVE